MYIQALPFAPSIAIGTELLGEGKAPAVPDGAEPSLQCGAGSTNQPGQEMVQLCLSSKNATVVKFPNWCTKLPCGFLN